jgi:hypothetical protein
MAEFCGVIFARGGINSHVGLFLAKSINNIDPPLLTAGYDSRHE